MSETVRLKSVSLIHGVLFDGATVAQITGGQFGITLEIAQSGLFVVARANPSKNRDPICIPMTNVKQCVLIDEARDAARAVEAKEKAKEVAKVVARDRANAKAPIKGVEQFYKDPETGEIKTRLV